MVAGSSRFVACFAVRAFDPIVAVGGGGRGGVVDPFAVQFGRLVAVSTDHPNLAKVYVGPHAGVSAHVLVADTAAVAGRAVAPH